MGAMMSARRRNLYVQAQDISDAPPWAIDLAARRWNITIQEKADCTRRLQADHGWTQAKVAKLFGVTIPAVSRWLRESTEEGKARAQDYQRERRERDPYRLNNHLREYRLQVRHGDATVRQAMWLEQDGRCYLCKRELGPRLPAVIEHDHRCCPPAKSCADCRRGLACNRCNRLIAFAHDDAELLATIAANLRPAVEAVTMRLAKRQLEHP